MRINRLRFGSLQALELGFLQLDLVFAQLVLFQHARIGIDHDDAAQAIDNQQLAVANQRTGILQTDHAGDRHAARQNRRMRGGAANISNERSETVILEGDHIGRCERSWATTISSLFLEPLSPFSSRRGRGGRAIP
jgi:hypothetical protein